MSQLTFNYRALAQGGVKKRGVIQAADQRDAYRKVAAKGLRPLMIAAARGSGVRGRKKRISVKDLSHLTYQLSVLLEARIPIADGLRSIAEQENNERFRAVIEDIAQQIEAGVTITDAMTPHRALFGEVYIETIRAAEASGNVIDILAHLAQMLDQQYETNKNVKGALLYPTCVISALFLAVTFLLIFVVPRFASMFESRGLELPLITEALVGASALFRSYWFLFLVGIGGGILTVRRMLKTAVGRRKVDGFMHRVPFLCDLLVGLAVSRFAHVFGLSLRSGLSLIEALEMAGAASGRPLLQADAEAMREQVRQGGRLTDVMMACGYLPGFARRMITAGEEAAEMPKMCAIVARHYDREVSHLAKNAATVIEPILIVGLAAIVLIIALAIFLPMWSMGSLIG